MSFYDYSLQSPSYVPVSFDIVGGADDEIPLFNKYLDELKEISGEFSASGGGEADPLGIIVVGSEDVEDLAIRGLYGINKRDIPNIMLGEYEKYLEEDTIGVDDYIESVKTPDQPNFDIESYIDSI
jgi:hypothetical protein